MWIDTRHHNSGCGFSDCTDFGFSMAEDVENIPQDAAGIADPPGQTHILWWNYRRYGGMRYSGADPAYGTESIYSPADNQGWSTTVLWCYPVSPNYDYFVQWISTVFTRQTATQQPYSGQQTFTFPCSSQTHTSFMDYVIMQAATR